MSQPLVVGLVLNYNGRDVTLETLASLVRTDYPAFSLLVVDNGSSDGSRAAIAAAYPRVDQVRVDENQGISFGINHGLRRVLDGRADYVLIMNNDIEVAPEMVGEMVRAAEADARIGCVGPKSYYWSDRERLWSAGGVLRFRESVTRERGDGQRDVGQFDRTEEVAYINGCAMLTRVEALRRTGLWDPVYYLGVEDADWCVRMKRQGFRCVYAHRARLWHKISHSIGVYKPTRTYHTGRSTAIFVRKYATRGQKLRVAASLLLTTPLAFLRELRHGNQRAAITKLRGFLDGWRVELQPPPLYEPPAAAQSPRSMSP